MRRVAVAVVVVAVIIGGAGVADQALGEPERIPLPEQGETVATSLSDGAPVFVSRDEEGGARVVSAVSTHLLHVVHWCADEGVFIEPIAATLFDPQGRWVTGPAATGLAHYDAEVDGDTVVVGELGDPQPRAERSDLGQHGANGCWADEGEDVDGTPPALPEEVALEDLSLHVGDRVVVTARAHVGDDGMRLCAHGRENCGPEEVELASTWWPGYFDDAEGWEDGRFLVRVVGARQVAELARPLRWGQLEELVRSELKHERERHDTVWAFGRLHAFDADAGTATFAELGAGPGEDPEMLPESDADGTVTLPLRDDAALTIERGDDRLHYYPHEFEQILEDRAGGGGHVPIEATIGEDGEIHSLGMLRFDRGGS